MMPAHSNPTGFGDVTTPAAPTATLPAPVRVKVVVSGGFGVGKTTLVAAISEIVPLTTEAAMTSVGASVDTADGGTDGIESKVTTTVAMDFGRVAIDESLVLHLFGTPGQERFGFMWDDLVEGALGAIVLLDSRRLADAFGAIDYYESRDIPFVVAVNRFDGELAHPLDDIRAALAVGPDVPVVACDARDGEDVREVLVSLLDRVLAHALERSQRRALR